MKRPLVLIASHASCGPDKRHTARGLHELEWQCDYLLTIEEWHLGESIGIIAIGEVDGVFLVVVYTDRGEVRRIISARYANKRERQIWQSFVNP